MIFEVGYSYITKKERIGLATFEFDGKDFTLNDLGELAEMIKENIDEEEINQTIENLKITISKK
ncbi:MAG: hypothetical protein GY793_00650 [Proteobacteria bacterium]|nr:hypothetical protein [Pseudomonadota bacterium]